MDSAKILKTLETERKLLENFIRLSEEQLRLFEDEATETVTPLIQQITELMIELTLIEGRLGTWITQIRNYPDVKPEMMQELRAVNGEIVNAANHIVEIDKEAHERVAQRKKSQGS